jgi:hypothetical protein
VPAGGTYFNFTLQSGVGATFQLTNNLHLVGGVHFFHLSNAAIRGINHNPDLNALEGYAGLIYCFDRAQFSFRRARWKEHVC